MSRAVAARRGIAPTVDRHDASPHEWVRQFDCRDVRPLIVCRGPVRLEAIDIFKAMGLSRIGMLLSDKDSTMYEDCVAPERFALPADCVHLIEDYQAASGQSRSAHIQQIIEIAQQHGYNAIFAGYGFMAEAADFVQAIADADLMFIGPSAPVVSRAGQKDDAKALARRVGVSITPGVDDLAPRALLSQVAGESGLLALAEKMGFSQAWLSAQPDNVAAAAALLARGRERAEPLLDFAHLAAQAVTEIKTLRQHYPNRTFRLKAVGGGGGKGQRLVSPDISDAQLAQDLPDLLRTVLQEVRATEPTDNQNVLIELNIDSSRHQEIQLVGNGQWCVALGGRDCSVQWREQKLVEISLTQEALSTAIEKCSGDETQAQVREALIQERDTLMAMEQDAEVFGEALGLDSVSTFECLVMPEGYAFMELNARIQVEHRVTEQCYALVFSNPQCAAETFEVQSLIALMVLLARHGSKLPKPKRRLISPAAAEIRLNATDAALAPHAGGVIERWALGGQHYLWDEQGIAARTTDDHMPYRLAGAYDSNVALLVVRGEDRQDCYTQLAQGLAQMTLVGKDLQINANFHQGILAWLGRDCIYPRVPTDVVANHLRAVAHVAHLMGALDLAAAWQRYGERVQQCARQGQPEKNQAAWQKVLTALRTFTLRPLLALQQQPHLAYAWVCGAGAFLKDRPLLPSSAQQGFVADAWVQNPLLWFSDTIKILGWLPNAETPIESMALSDTGFWQEDFALLARGQAFYENLQARGIYGDEAAWDLSILSSRAAPSSVSAAEWAGIQKNHAAYGIAVGFWQWVLTQIQVTQSPLLPLTPSGEMGELPSWLSAWDLAAAQHILSPPPKAPDNEIVAISGGMFYAQECPGAPPFVQVGQRFKRGDTLYIIEVMKMFNPVKAECDGVVEAVLVSGMDGQVVRKGQPLFKIKPEAVAQATQGHAVPMPPNCFQGEVPVEQWTEVGLDRWFNRQNNSVPAPKHKQAPASAGVN